MCEIAQIRKRQHPQGDGQATSALEPSLVLEHTSKNNSVKSWILSRLIVCLALVFQPYSVNANPTGETIVHGSADVVRDDPAHLTINQHTDKAIIDWTSFSIGAAESVTFAQPSSSSLAVNRVVGNESSSILGQLTANGRLMLINPNGILFGAGSRVDVNSLIATTIDISNDRILADDFTFDQMSNPAATIVNRGTITAAEGGLVALVAPGVENTGVIQARLGTVSLASGHEFTLDLYGDGLVKLPLDEQTVQELFAPDGTPLKGLVNNSGTIQADGGTVLLTAQTATNILDRVINMEGIVEANSVAEVNGQIVLSGGDVGIVAVAGTLKASGDDSDETGGSIKVLGEKVGLFDNARVDVSGDAGGGEVLIGGNFQGKGPEQNAKKTYIGEDAKIDAHAKTSGDGGRVIVWADETTQYYGGIDARGGSTIGNGGFAEVSGKQNLDFRGTADLTAVNGDLGSLLLDPLNVIVATGGGAAAADVDEFTDNAGTTQTIDPTTLDGVGGNVTLEATNDITFTNAVNLTTAAATLTAQAQNAVNVNANITTNGGAITLIADDDASGVGTFTQATGTGVSSGGADISITADDIDLQGTATINSGAGRTTLDVADGGTITLAGAGADMNLSNAEINAITAGILQIGTSTSGILTVAADIAPAGTTTLSLRSSHSIVATAGGIVEDNLSAFVTGANSSSFFTNADNDIGTFAGNAGGRSLEVVDSNSISIGVVDGVTGATIGRNFTLTATTGNITIDSPVSVNRTGTFTTSAADGLITVNAAVNNSTTGINRAFFFISDKIDINSTISMNVADDHTIVIRPTTAGRTIDLGSIVDNTANALELSAAEVANVQARYVVIGNTDSGNITVTDDTTFAGTVNNRLQTAGTVTATAASGGGLIAASRLGIDADGAVEITEASTDVDDLAIFTTTGNITFTDLDGFNVTTDTDAASTAIVTGVDTNNGAVGLTATTGNITVINTANANDIEATGNITLTAAANEATVDVQASADVESSAGNISVISDIISLPGTLTASAGTNQSVTLAPETAIDADVIDVGTDGTIADRFEITNTVIDQITTDTVVIGSSGSGALTVSADITLANATGLDLRSGSTVTATAGGIIEDTLAVTAGGTATFSDAQQNVTTLAISAAGQTVNYTETTGYDIGAVNGMNGATAGTLNLSAGGALTDTQAITATNLSITNTTADTTLDVATSDVDNLAVNAAGRTVSFRDADDLDIDTVNSIVGATATTLNLTTGGALTDAQAVTATNLSVTAGGAVTLDTAANDVDTLAIDTSTGNVTFTDTDGFSVGTVNGVTGIDTDAGAVALTATTGTLTVSNTAAANDVEASGDIALTAAADEALIDIQASADVESTGGAITVTADDINIAGTITNTGRTVTLAPETVNDADVIDLGPDASAANRFELAAADIDNVTAGTLVIGTSASGAMNIEADITPANTTTLHLQSGGAVTGTAGGIVETNLAVTAAGTVDISDTTTDVDNLAVSAAGQAVTFVDTDDLALATVNGIIDVTAGALNLTAGGALTGSLTATALQIAGTSAILTGTVNGLAGQLAANAVTFTGSVGAGPYTMNGFAILAASVASVASVAVSTLASTSAQDRAVTIPPSIINTQVHQTLLGAVSSPTTSSSLNRGSGSDTPYEALLQDLLTEHVEPNIYQNNFQLVALPEDTKIAFNKELDYLGDFWSPPEDEDMWLPVSFPVVGQEDEQKPDNFQALEGR